jgi:hypothetical protein
MVSASLRSSTLGFPLMGQATRSIFKLSNVLFNAFTLRTNTGKFVRAFQIKTKIKFGKKALEPIKNVGVGSPAFAAINGPKIAKIGNRKFYFF